MLVSRQTHRRKNPLPTLLLRQALGRTELHFVKTDDPAINPVPHHVSISDKPDALFNSFSLTTNLLQKQQ